MKHYKYFFEERGGVIQKSPKAYEDIEWVNFWINNHRDNKLGYIDMSPPKNKRYLFLGDSSLRMVRKKTQYKNENIIDLFATSSSFQHSFFASQIDAFFEENPFKYDGIFIQIGYHSLKNEQGQWYTNEDYCQYKLGYLATIDYLKQFTEKIVVMSSFTAVIPRHSKIGSILNRFGLIKEILDTDSNKVIEQKNLIAEDVAIHSGCTFLDMKALMQEHPRFRRSDTIHYFKSGLEFVSKEMQKYMY